MSYEITGTLLEKYDAVQVTDRFRKREFVIEKRESVGPNEFIETIKFQLTQDKCEAIENIPVGQQIKVVFNIRGRRWEKNGQVSYFNNLEAWRVEPLQQQSAPANTAPPPAMDEIPPEGPSDDLPF
ncbi:MAG: DUF3127 domain-containing protein [Bacteroidales bacterium]|jgi:hypothetical protein|nr:DUF3127 domain-containing protein [Bacteroidales bacterium]